MHTMFDPKSIAVIGASEAEGSVGRTIMENALASGGRTVYPVNPKHDTILGVQAYKSIGEVPEAVDLAMVATPASTVPDVLAECVAAGVKGAIVVSAGFSETGAEGAALEARIREVLKDSGMRLVGPNCLGIIRPGVKLNASFLRINPEPGNIALISQSGALGTGMLDWAIDAHVGFSMFASVGGMTDIDFADLIDYLGEDEDTRAILIYMESIGNARRFMSAARGFARNKPIIVLKPGRYAESAKAALSHTGSMAGGDEIYEAAFRRVGVVRVHEVAELFHAAGVLDSNRLPEGRDVAIVTNAGGLGVMATDSIVEYGGRLAALSNETMDTLNAALPAYWSHNNPIDVLGDAPKDRFVAAVEACIADPGVNGILLIYTPQGNARPDEMATEVARLAHTTAKPVITCLMGGESIRNGRHIFMEAGVPTYDTPEEAVKTYLGMYRYSRNLELLYETPAELATDAAPPRHNLEAMLRRTAKHGRLVLTEEESKRFLATYGMPTVPQQTAADVRQALKAAEEIGYPVVLKIVSHDITHKNAAGGVEVGVCSPPDLEKAYQRILDRVAEREPDATVEGIAVQKMIRPIDYELILGMKKDRQFGSVVVFGAGGTGAERMADFSVALPPLNTVLARRMMEETRIFKVMANPPKGVTQPDLPALEEILTQLSNLVVDFPEIAEIDVNPVVVSEGKAMVVDARIIIDQSVLDGAPDMPHLVVTPYPTRYIAPWRMNNGTEVLLRPIRPEDERMIGDMLSTMSARSLGDRFYDGVPEFTHARLVRFTNIDYEREIAIVAEHGKDGHSKRIVGVGRLIGEPERGCGEFTVLVHDDYQGRGLGFKLVDVIIGIAEEKGFSSIIGHVTAGNKRMLELTSELGFKPEDTVDGVTRICLELG
ncbi:MAG TPA: bifunctional acetate--CoA ligase family protein/GNAT family N-acetyltransferase [Coriobacteriia bacterium]|nr:bifunctional acetate--CoA ligase family protein/GNAT family N-acetyltransferase [Coriobacteriia bacterium]